MMIETPKFAQQIPDHLLEGARILSGREKGLDFAVAGGVFVEVGVALGDFTEKVIARCAPRKYIAVDLFNIDHFKTLWGRPTSEYFGDKTHLQFYKDRFKRQIEEGQIELKIGNSLTKLNELDNKSVDTFYVDAGHYYPEVRDELAIIGAKVKDDGLIIMNDYIFFDHAGGTAYGVVQATNEFMVKNEWKMVYLALHRQMYCDVGLMKYK